MYNLGAFFTVVRKALLFYSNLQYGNFQLVHGG